MTKHLSTLLAALLLCVTLFGVLATAEETEAEHTLTLEDFAHARIGVEADTTESYLTETLLPEAEILSYNNASDVALALARDKVDALMISDFVASKLCLEYPNFRKLASFNFEYYGVAFPKTEKGAQLQMEFNAFLKECRSLGTMEEMYALWMSEDTAAPTHLDLGSLPATNGVLRMAADNVYEPFVYVSHGKPIGFDVDLVYRFCLRFGYGLEIYAMNFDSVIASVNTENCDLAASGISITEERKESLLFSDPYFIDSTCLVYCSDNEELDDGSLLDSFDKTFLREGRWLMILNGIKVTLHITCLAVLYGTLLALLLCIFRNYSRTARLITNAYIKVFQGTPQLVLLMFFYYVVFGRARFSADNIAVFSFSLNFAAYAVELFEAGISAVDEGQREAALSMGYTEWQSFIYYILPQAAEHFLPIYRSEVVSLLKNTSIVGYITIQDLTKVGDSIRARTYEAFFPLIIVALLYFLLSYLLIFVIRRVEFHVTPNRTDRTVKGVKLRDQG